MASWDNLYERLRNGLFLSSMIGKTDGAFCAERGRGCAMVQLGAYLAEPPAYKVRPYVLPPERDECVQFLKAEFMKVKESFDTVVCVNLATPELDWGIKAAECVDLAGGDILELNIHGGYKPYFERGRLRAMVLPENRGELFKWLSEFSRLDIPVIVKFRKGFIDDYSPILDRVVDMDLFGVHFNVRDDISKRPDFNFVRWIKENYDLFLLVSGYVRSANDVVKLFKCGADMVGIAEPVLTDPNYIQRIASNLKRIR